jgi:hypothetical protein
MLAIGSLHLLDFLDRPSTFPSDQDSQRDLAQRIDRIPAVLKRGEEIDRDSKYHLKRATTLREIHELKTAPAGTSKAKLEAEVRLLKATDDADKAQVVVDNINAATRP